MLGDDIEKVIEKLVPQHIVEKAKKKGCNCKKRKEKLNKLHAEVNRNINAIFS